MKRLSLLLILTLIATMVTVPALGESENAYSLVFDNTAWQYNGDDQVYWQVGVVYCAQAETTAYESLGIYVPAAYMDAVANGDGTYTCALNATGTVNGYTAQTAPIVMPVNTAGYSAQAAPTGYENGVSSYTSAGFIYVYAGCRGRDNGYDDSGNLIYNGGAPWGVTDLKAAVRYLRYNNDVLPGDTERIFTFGHSGGGAQSSLMGATGDSELYYAYLESIGAAMYDGNGNYISDAICGAMCWCPITSLDYANEAYEWQMGQFSDSGTRADDTWTSAFSDDLASAYADYINAAQLTDEDGNVLTLKESESGIYLSGSYYDYLLSQIETSLNNFLQDTQFPYTAGSGSVMADGGQTGDMPSGDMPSGDRASGTMPDGEMPTDRSGGESFEGMPAMDGSLTQDASAAGASATAGQGRDSQAASSTTYETPQDYIDSLNGDDPWITYDAQTNTATITSVQAFVTHCKNASKSVGAFDDLNRGQAENKVFGDQQSDALHFDATMAALLLENQDKYATYADWDAAYVQAYQEYLDSSDALNFSSSYRQDMYNPMYYLSSYYEGSGTSTVAKYWRIHSGINQGDTALTVEMNLYLALAQCEDVADVALEMVWGQGHTAAERTGDSTTHFIQWVDDCCQDS